MQHNISLFFVISCTAASIYCMDTKEKTVDLKAQFATISWLQNTHPKEVKVLGLKSAQQETTTAALQQAFLTSLQAATFEFPDKASATPTVCIDMQKLTPLLAVLKQMEQDEQRKKEKAKALIFDMVGNPLFLFFPDRDWRLEEDEHGEPSVKIFHKEESEEDRDAREYASTYYPTSRRY